MQHPKNIVLVTVDALRTDVLGCYGNTDNLTPALDEISREALVCQNCFTTSSATSASIASIFTSQNPYEHGVRFVGEKNNKKNLSFLSLLKQKYNTVGFPSVETLNKYFDFDEGFMEFYDHIKGYTWLRKAGIGRFNLLNIFSLLKLIRRLKHRISGHEINLKVESWLKKKGDKPFFLWVHYFDIHTFSTNPGPWDTPEHSGDTVLAKNLYNSAVKEFDLIFSDLISILKNHTDFSQTVIAVTADHGEMLGEAPGFTEGVSFTQRPGFPLSTGHYLHGSTLYNSEISVPLIIKVPGLEEKIVLNEIVRTIDIAPTFLNLLKIPKPDTFRGESILKLIKNPNDKGREAYMESIYADKTGICYDGWKLIINGTNYLREPSVKVNKNELYNIHADPLEQNNLSDEKPALVSELHGRLKNLLGSNSINAVSENLSPEVKAELVKLGYLKEEDGKV